MARNKKVYWIGLLRVLRKACDYYDQWEASFPNDIPESVKTAGPYIRAACMALRVYDKTHKGGQGV